MSEVMVSQSHPSLLTSGGDVAAPGVFSAPSSRFLEPFSSSDAPSSRASVDIKLASFGKPLLSPLSVPIDKTMSGHENGGGPSGVGPLSQTGTTLRGHATGRPGSPAPAVWHSQHNPPAPSNPSHARQGKGKGGKGGKGSGRNATFATGRGNRPTGRRRGARAPTALLFPLGALVSRAIRPSNHRSRMESRCEISPHRLLYRRRAQRFMFVHVFVAARHPRPMSLSLDRAAHELHARPPPSPGALTRAVASPSQVHEAVVAHGDDM